MLEPTTNSPAPLPDYAPPPGVLGTKIPSTVTLAVAVLLFVMPFVEIKCNSMTIQSISGVQLATGFKIKSEVGDSYLSPLIPDSESKKQTKVEREDPNMFALIALLLGITGVILCLISLKAGGIGGLLTGIAGAASLIGLMIDASAKFKLKIPDDGGKEVKMSIGFSPYFYIAIILFLTAAFFSYKRMKANYK